jgi:hypothetical protein
LFHKFICITGDDYFFARLEDFILFIRENIYQCLIKAFGKRNFIQTLMEFLFISKVMEQSIIKVFKRIITHHVLFLMCRRSRGWGSFNKNVKFFIIDTPNLFNIMCRRISRLDNLSFIKREKR